MKMNERKEILANLMAPVFGEAYALKLVNILDEMHFFTAPASTKYHGAYKGGLFDHSYAVTEELVKLTKANKLEWDDTRSPYLIGMLHDLCKCDAYIVKTANSHGMIDGLPDFVTSIEYNKKQLLTGHGDKSVILAQQVMTKLCGEALTEEEILCIRWHMGAFDEKENWGAYGLACEKYPNVLYTHTADMIASKVVGI